MASMVRVLCQTCGVEMALVNPDYLDEKVSRGEYLRGGRIEHYKDWEGAARTKYVEGVFGICRDCKRQAATAPTKGGSEAAEAQGRRIRDRLALIRERRPDLTLEQAAHAATNDEFDPHNEPNLAFRAFLLERSHLDAAERSLWRKFRGKLRDLFGPHAGGVA